MSQLAAAIDRRVRASVHPPNIRVGRLVSVSTRRVMVSGITEQPIACHWSAFFAQEVASMGADTLQGRQVEVHIAEGQQPIIAYTIVTGETP